MYLCESQDSLVYIIRLTSEILSRNQIKPNQTEHVMLRQDRQQVHEMTEPSSLKPLSRGAEFTKLIFNCLRPSLPPGLNLHLSIVAPETRHSCHGFTSASQCMAKATSAIKRGGSVS